MPIPSNPVQKKRIEKKSYLLVKCPYYPCHKELENCNLCFCPFYPCEEEKLGFYKKTSKGGQVWSCLHCTWNHKEEVLEKSRNFFAKEEVWEMEGRERFEKFVKEAKLLVENEIPS